MKSEESNYDWWKRGITEKDFPCKKDKILWRILGSISENENHTIKRKIYLALQKVNVFDRVPFKSTYGEIHDYWDYRGINPSWLTRMYGNKKFLFIRVYKWRSWLNETFKIIEIKCFLGFHQRICEITETCQFTREQKKRIKENEKYLNR